MDKRIAFIGAGNMGGAVASSAAQAIPAREIVITDTDHRKALKLAQGLGAVHLDDNAEAVKAARYIVLGVKPQVLPAVLAEIDPILKECADRGEKRILVSLAAGYTIAQIRTLLEESGPQLPIIRILANTPAMIGEGLMIIIAGSGVAEEEIAGLEECIAACGKVVHMPDEKTADAALVLGGCTPAFTYMFIEALADGAVTMGLTREQGYLFAAQAVKGAAAMVLNSGGHLSDLKDAV